MYQVYLVDDESLILEDLVNTVPWMENGFEIAGYQSDPVKAIPEILGKAPDVVFCDLKMPAMNGNEVIRRLRSEGLETEYVMLSAYDSFEDVREFFLQSGFDYILKPVGNEELQIVLEKLNKHLSEKKGVPEKEPVSSNPAFNALVEYVDAHYAEKLSLNHLSEQFALSKSYICMLFQKHFNKSLYLYLTDLRMSQAKRLLQDRSCLIKEIALKSGYTDYYHFFRVFKSYYGISPREMLEGAGARRK